MRDPTRLRDPHSKSPASLRRIIEAVRSDLPDTTRLRDLAERLGFGASAVPSNVGAVKGGAAALGGAATKIGAVVVLVLGAGAGVLATNNLVRSPPTVVAVPSAVRGASPSSLRPTLAPQVVGAGLSIERPQVPLAEQAPRAASTSITRGTSTAAVTTDGLTATAPAASFLAPPVATGGAGTPTSQPDVPPTETEFSLVEQAQRALGGDPRRAIDLTDRHARRYPSGALAQEREVIAIEALLQLGRANDARARASLFFQSFPGSAHGRRIAALLGFDGGLP